MHSQDLSKEVSGRRMMIVILHQPAVNNPNPLLVTPLSDQFHLKVTTTLNLTKG